MQTELLVVAYYTSNTGYAIEVQNLIASLRLLNLPHEIRAITNKGDWQANTHFKAEFLRAMLRTYANGPPLLYVDADAVIRQTPCLLFGLDADIAVHYRTCPRMNPKDPKDGELLSGTIYARPTPATMRLLDRWIAINRCYPDNWDQVNLQTALSESLNINVVYLPPEYTFIFDSMRQQYPHAKPVIEHFQASRKYKDKVGRSVTPTESHTVAG